jgi:hypothetical protein
MIFLTNNRFFLFIAYNSGVFIRFCIADESEKREIGGYLQPKLYLFGHRSGCENRLSVSVGILN